MCGSFECVHWDVLSVCRALFSVYRALLSVSIGALLGVWLF